MGAALATLFSYAAMAIGLYLVGQRFYPMKYEISRLLKIAAAGVAVFSLYYFVRLDTFEVVWKFGLLVLFGLLMYLLRFFEPTEIKAITRRFSRQPSRDPVSGNDGFSEPK
jgi:uncharacterized membrane protein